MKTIIDIGITDKTLAEIDRELTALIQQPHIVFLRTDTGLIYPVIDDRPIKKDYRAGVIIEA